MTSLLVQVLQYYLPFGFFATGLLSLTAGLVFDNMGRLEHSDFFMRVYPRLVFAALILSGTMEYITLPLSSSVPFN